MPVPGLKVGNISIPLSMDPSTTLASYVANLGTNVVLAVMETDELKEMFSEAFFDKVQCCYTEYRISIL
jgi:hypothetical protein